MAGRRTPKKTQERLAMGELEASVMDLLWDGGGWQTPGEIQQALSNEHEVAYTTVTTILVRLADKGRVVRERDGRAFAYRPTKTRAEHAAARMRDALGDGDNRSGALAAFVASLGTKDRDQLRRVLTHRDAKRS